MVNLDTLLKKHQEYDQGVDLDLVRHAYAFAEAAHLGQKRRNGEDEIAHLLKTADYLADYRVDSVTLAAALLHDVLEESDIDRQMLAKEFNEEIAALVDGLTVVRAASGRVEIGKGKDWENLRHLILASIHDPRVMIIRLADKIHNLRTSSVLTEEERRISAQKVFDIWAPLAEILGLYRFKSEMEDQAFEILHPREFESIKSAVRSESEKMSRVVDLVSDKISTELHHQSIPVEITSRTKHLFGVYRKMTRYKSHPGGRLFDVLGLRVVTDTVENCYRVLDIVRRLWKEVPELFDDYIANPKVNGYQSLHAVFEVNQHPVEIQIRTGPMHEVAEYGLATHSIYKEKGDRHVTAEERIRIIKSLLVWGKGRELDLFPDRVFVFTPKGDVKVLPKGATPVDFAFAVHTQIGRQCAGAKANGKVVSLDYPLKTGEMIEIITAKGRKPSPDWLRFVKTEQARSEIEKMVRG
ncbi:MAG: GTP pyrophosphokinase, GTP pyrophosphokinase [candidate division WWE3 bacterium CSP1-7]|uniref:GTP pyrophosphokinase, GTP pyrophosphokinase n=1 Tax=candidate division WWE3 bacterium CSP1-7 TaxID=1576480 RepID=A0A0T5ZY04_UNCKA|nr:MAG: GTP pyrophosphokinase, GTP pyrophosphokinase [candidate division WWE3 bacterium CSP1-7]